MTHTFVSERVRLFVIGIFIALLFAPGFVFSLVDRLTTPHPPDVQAFLSGLSVVFGLGLLWTLWLTRPPIVVTGSKLVERRSFRWRTIELAGLTRLERRKGRVYRTLIDDLKLRTADGAVVAELDLLRVRDADELVALLRKLTGAQVVEERITRA